MAPRKAAKKTTATIEVPVVPNAVCAAYGQWKQKIDVIRKITEIVPKGTGESDTMVLMRTIDNDKLRMTYGHFGYGASVDIPVTNGGVVFNHAIPLDTLAGVVSPDIVQLSLMADQQTLNIRVASTQVRVIADDPIIVERQIPEFLENCFDSFSLSEEQFSGLLKQVVFKSTDLSIKGTGLPVRIKSDSDTCCYKVIARDSAFGVIKEITASIESEVDVTLSHQFLKVVSDTLNTNEAVMFGFDEEMTSCRALIGDGCAVWAPIPAFENWDLLEWRTNTVTTEQTLAEMNVPFSALMGALDTIVPHFKLDDQTNNVRISLDLTVAPANILIVFESSRIAVGGRVPCEVIQPIQDTEILTDGKRMAAFLKCGKTDNDQVANVKLFPNHLFVNIAESQLEFILPLR
jgi:hypothetical protein